MAVGLKGENRVRKFKRVAEELSSRIASSEEVAGIVFHNALTRDFADEFSDLDIMVFLSKKNTRLRRHIYEMGIEEERRSGNSVDLEVHFLDEFKGQKWNEAEKWDLSRAKIVYDPQGETNRVFNQKLRVHKGFWLKRIVICSEYLKWYCCPPGRDAAAMAEVWIKRGDLISAHYCLNYGVDLLVRVIFALNKEFLPAPKWRIFYSHKLEWLPEGYQKLVEETIKIKNPSSGEVNRRLKAIRRIWSLVLPKIEEETQLTPRLISKIYVERTLHQPWISSYH
jgi:predicted nucleotidyltransferase